MMQIAGLSSRTIIIYCADRNPSLILYFNGNALFPALRELPPLLLYMYVEVKYSQL